MRVEAAGGSASREDTVTVRVERGQPAAKLMADDLSWASEDLASARALVDQPAGR